MKTGIIMWMVLLHLNFVAGAQITAKGFDTMLLLPLNADTTALKSEGGKQYPKMEKLEEKWRNVYKKEGGYYYYYEKRYEEGSQQIVDERDHLLPLQIIRQKREQVALENFSLGSNVGRGAVALVLPGFITTSSSRDLLWQYNALLKQGPLNYNFQLYIPGEHLKESRSVKDERSIIGKGVSTASTYYIHYDKGGLGIQLMGEDTLSTWNTTITPLSDSNMAALAKQVLVNHPLKRKQKAGLFVYNEALFGATGYWEKMPFILLFNDMDNRAWIFSNDSLVAVFQYPGLPQHRTENLLKVSEDGETFKPAIILNPYFNSNSKRESLVRLIACTAWMVDVFARSPF